MNRRGFFAAIAAAVTGRKQAVALAYKSAGHLFYKIPPSPPISGIAIARANMPTFTPFEIEYAYKRMNALRGEWTEAWTAAREVTCVFPDGSRKTVQINNGVRVE